MLKDKQVVLLMFASTTVSRQPRHEGKIRKGLRVGFVAFSLLVDLSRI